MSFVQINTLGPLTTIFKPPVGCFEQFPQTWSTCNTGYISPYYGLNCYLSQPESCYPTSALINEWHGKDFTYAADYWYSPGVLPSGFTPVAALTTSDATTIYGCLSGWNFWNPVWCSLPTSGSFIYGETKIGSFAAVLPVVVVTWDAGDLASFTPASAPVLPTSASAAARSRSSIPTSTAGSAPASHSQGSGLSTGAKAGIGVGVAIAVLLAVIIAFVFFRRSRRRTRAYQSQRVGHLGNQRPYVDSKAELPVNEKSKKDGVEAVELQDREPQELDTNREPPPVPLASKPRFDGAREGDDTGELA